MYKFRRPENVIEAEVRVPDETLEKVQKLVDDANDAATRLEEAYRKASIADNELKRTIAKAKDIRRGAK